MSVICELYCTCTVYSGSYSAVSNVIHGVIVLSINTNTKQNIQYSNIGLKFSYNQIKSDQITQIISVSKGGGDYIENM